MRGLWKSYNSRLGFRVEYVRVTDTENLRFRDDSGQEIGYAYLLIVDLLYCGLNFRFKGLLSFVFDSIKLLMEGPYFLLVFEPGLMGDFANK